MIMVDELRTWPHARGIFKKGSCHLTSDGPDALEQLHAFARLIGLRREWFQNGRVAHYDLTPKRRVLAFLIGAKFVPAKEQARQRRQAA